jgi:hypothetical protein
MGRSGFREFVLPGLVRQVQAAHGSSKYFIKHTDGNVWRILDTFIDAASRWLATASNPLSAWICVCSKSANRGKLCFFGGGQLRDPG